MKNTRAAAAAVLVGAGSRCETKEINGISHFLEHMLFKGTKKRPSTMKLAEPLDETGGEYNAFTGKEHTVFWAKVGAENFGVALDFVSDIFLNSLIKEKEIEKEKGVIIEEINMYLDSPARYAADVWERLLYGGQPAGRLILGEKDTIKKMKRRHFLAYLKKHYVAGNTVVCAAGNISAEKTEKKIGKLFGKIRPGRPPRPRKIVERQKEPAVAVHFKKTDQAHLVLGARGCHLFHPLYYAQKVLAAVLGGFMSSRLWISIREKNGLAYYVRTAAESFTDAGYVATRAGVDNGRVAKAAKLVLREYAALKRKKIGAKELRKAKENLKGSLALSLETSDERAMFCGWQELFTGKILTPEQKFKKIDAVTAGDVQKAAAAAFRPENLNLAVVGPFKKAAEFKKLLKLL